MNNPEQENKSQLEEARNRIERGFRVKFEREPNQTERTLIELASYRVAEGESFHWEGTTKEPIYRVGLPTEQDERTSQASDLLALEADQSSRIKEDVSGYFLTKTGEQENVKEEVSLKINARESQYCRLRAMGETQANAYYGAGYKPSSSASASVCASQLERRPHVSSYLRRLKESSFMANVLSLAEKRSGLADAWRTPVGQIDEHHPLAQEVIIKEFTDKEGNVTGTEKKVKMVSKLEALKLDAQLAGELKESTSNQANFSVNLLMSGLEETPLSADYVQEIPSEGKLPE